MIRETLKMRAKSLSQAATLYEDDFAAWASETARLLREGRFGEIDVEHVAEEIEGMANRDKRELMSRLRIQVLHLLKWQHQPEKRSRSWRATIVSQRAELADLLEQSPSLKRAVSELAVRGYRDAVEQASAETGLSADSFPGECPFSPAQLLDRRFLPGR